MKYIPFIKNSIKALFKENLIVFISFIIGPLIISLIYGTMMKSIFDGVSHMDKINVHFVCDDGTRKGAVFKDILNNDDVKSFINEDESADIEVEINDDFSNINIKNNGKDSKDIEAVKEFMYEVSANFNKYNVISERTSNLDPVKVKEVLDSYTAKIQQNNDEKIFNKKLIEGYKTLDSWEYYGISTFTFTSILILVIFINRFFSDKKDGIVRRTLSASVTKKEYITSFFICSSLEALIINSVYVTLLRTLNLSFSGSILGLIAIVIGQSLLQGGISALIISLFKSKKVINLILIIFITVSSILGGALYNLDFVDINLLQVLRNISLNTLILNAYKLLAVSNNAFDYLKYVLIMILMSIACLIISRFKVNLRWEEI